MFFHETLQLLQAVCFYRLQFAFNFFLRKFSCSKYNGKKSQMLTSCFSKNRDFIK